MIQQSTFLGISLRTVAHRRGLVLAYYALVFTFLAVMLIERDGSFLPGAMIVQTLTLGALFGGFKAGGPVKGYNGKPSHDEENPVTTLNLSGRSVFTRTYLLDERERAARDYAHYVAYRILLLTLATFMVLIVLTITWTELFFQRNAVTFLWVILVYALSLPQSVILWTEPEPLAEGSLLLVEAK